MLMYNEVIYILKIVLIMTAKSKGYKSLFNYWPENSWNPVQITYLLVWKKMFKLNLITSSIRKVKKIYKTN